VMGLMSRAAELAFLAGEPGLRKRALRRRRPAARATFRQTGADTDKAGGGEVFV
jgi:hypothetical protein